ncbi:hypothetical protein [Antrihabitans spumae]|uniref:EcsC family protein n=1 Tax=Antrihabitans spumae TaxID=3373370 RepID=A0ABW7KQ36_9NOCA
MAFWKERVERTVRSVLDDGSRLQAPAVAKYVDKMRRAHPDETPAQIIARMEKLFLIAVTGSGTAVGAAAAAPGVGTAASLAAAGAETAFFLEASALLTLAVASVHGIAPTDDENRRALVLAVALGDSGMDIVERTVGHSAKNWGTLLTNRIPGIGSMNDNLLKKFITRFVAKRAALMAGKIIPAGIGAVIGGAGNRVLGKGVISNSHKAFGPPPAHWPAKQLLIEPDPQPSIES